MAVPTRRPWAGRWWGKLLLLLASAVLLDLSFAPFNQFYLAYVAIVPWLIVVRESRSWLTAFFWGWVGGVIFFDLNMWWLAYVTGPGLAALMAVLGLYWGTVAAIIRGTRLLEPKGVWQRGAAQADAPPCRWAAVVSMVLIAVVWTSLEWLHGTWPLGGLAWAYVGHTQSPAIDLCQIADFSGVYGVSFLVLMINACVALCLIHRQAPRRLIPATFFAMLTIVAALGYGIFRCSQKTTRPGPTVLLVQPNYPQSNTGEKGADSPTIAGFHLRETRKALAGRSGVDLIVWSETMMPPVNLEARQYMTSLKSETGQEWGAFLNEVNAELEKMAVQYHACLLTGGLFQNDFTIKTDEKGDRRVVAMDRRNTAYFYTPQGQSQLRYDKIHLVPFGESLPFKDTLPPAYRLILALSPYTEEYTLTPGGPEAMTVFQLPAGQRFVTPICFEDLDGDLVRRMFKPETGAGKRADFVVNITNDGWFRFNEMPQHLQAAVFRSIENRVPTARSVNTGVSGFIDSVGRVSDVIPAGQEGTRIATLRLDDRVTFYTRFGDVFVYACAGVTIVLVLWGVIRWRITRRAAGTVSTL